MSKKRQIKKVPLFNKSSQKTRISKSVDEHKNKRISWAISTFDFKGPWGIKALQSSKWTKHLTEHISSYETMTWDEILKASGGRGIGRGNNNHEISIESLSKQAKDRLTKLSQFEDIDTIFSLRLEGVIRIYGIRDDNIFKILWFDPWHNKPKQCVCPVKI